jgi:dolichol kinase
MTACALALDSHDLALELLELLREIDPSRWSEDLARAYRARLEEISQRIDALLELPSAQDLLHRAQADARVEALRLAWSRVAEVLEQHAHARPGMGAEELQAEWMAFRARLQGAYEGLSHSLRCYAIHLPHLRPTNYARNLLHASGATASIAFVQLVFAAHPHAVLLTAGGVAAAAWTMETSRRYLGWMDRFTWWVFGKAAHPHERYRVNSATWFSTSLFLLALLGSPVLATVALAVMGFADPAAALVGRRWGRLKLLHGRSLEGSLAFLGVGMAISLGLLVVFFPGVPYGTAVGLALGGAGLGGLAEAVAKRLDDNLVVPLAAAAGAALMAWAVGLPL